MHLNLKKYFGKYEIHYSEYSGLRGTGLISTYWEVILSNIGSIPIAIIDYETWTNIDGGLAQYSDFNQGLFMPIFNNQKMTR